MIGDDVKDDVIGAKAIGCKGILVKTGKYRPGDEDIGPSSPDLTCDSFDEVANAIVGGLV